jgi:hypothetical protein
MSKGASAPFLCKLFSTLTCIGIPKRKSGSQAPHFIFQLFIVKFAIMLQNRFVETLTPGFYFKPEIKIGNYVEPARCYFITGSLKGNKWVDFDNHNPAWMSLSWTSINKEMMIDTTYHASNPTNLTL